MMFRRARPKRIREHARDMFWPRIGLSRAIRYWWLRLLRLPGTPYSIAAGVAIGAAVCFTPFVGLQWGIALILSWLARASLIAATVGTLVANPWTYPLIWVGLYETGSWILGGNGADLADAEMSISYLLAHAWEIFVPMLVASLPVAPTVGVLVYYPMRALVRKQHRRRIGRRLPRAGPAE
ncbi:MAG: DUF2062 domain-containing protein [Alphaproteobacteria bacterium]|nr:DUF2062 domain-containing protein [Alphaproteobacteria bacterium]